MSETAPTPEHDPDVKHMKDDINTPMLVVAIAVTTVLVIVCIIGVQALYYYAEGLQNQEKVVDAEYPESVEILRAAKQSLTEVRWVDQSKGIVTMPIEDAMQVVVSDIQTQQSATEPAPQPPSDESPAPEGEESPE